MMEQELLKKYDSPLYVYDYDKLIEKCFKMKKFSKKIEDSLKIKVSIHYSSKANNNLEILKIINNHGLSIDAMSPLELYLAEKACFVKEQILYVCNNVTEEEMKLVSDKDILMCFDSVSQVETFGKICPNKDIMIRINPGTLGVGFSKKVITSGIDTKFGICEEEFDNLFEVIKKYNLNIVGVHQHLGSLFLNDKIDDYLLGIKTSVNIIKRYFKNIKIVDFGGGFGVPYKDEEQLDLDLLADKLNFILKELKDDLIYLNEIKFEPGRYIVCEAGYILGLVTSIKKNKDTIWIGTDIGMNVLVRPSMYSSYHKIEILNNNKKQIICNVCGNICESADVLGKDRLINEPKVGDIVKVYNAGAYGYSMSSNYTGRLRPAEIIMINNNEKLIRNKETIDNIISLF